MSSVSAYYEAVKSTRSTVSFWRINVTLIRTTIASHASNSNFEDINSQFQPQDDYLIQNRVSEISLLFTLSRFRIVSIRLSESLVPPASSRQHLDQRFCSSSLRRILAVPKFRAQGCAMLQCLCFTRNRPPTCPAFARLAVKRLSLNCDDMVDSVELFYSVKSV